MERAERKTPEEQTTPQMNIYVKVKPSLSYFLDIFMSWCNNWASFLVSKKCFKTMNLLQIDVQISKIFPPAAGHSFLLSLFILVLDIRFFSTFSFYSCTRYPPNIPNARENVRSRTAEYFSIADCLIRRAYYPLLGDG